LNAGVWFRRARRVIFPPDMRRSSPPSGRKSTYPTVQILRASSGRDVVASFDGGQMTSDAGALLLGATDRAVRLIERFAACFTDARDAALVLLRHNGRWRLCWRLLAPQHGHRGSRLTRATMRRRRMVAIELGMCRSGRIGGASGSITFG